MKPWYKYYLSQHRWFILLAFFLIVTVQLPTFRILSAANFSAFYLLLISIAFGILINRVTYKIETLFLKQILNNKGLLYIGKISYGLYLYHNFIPYFYNIEIPVALTPISIYLTQCLRMLTLISIASFSWFFVEKPILRLKNRYVVV
jgi:peptidoglycan/LPS O-acetylase OafA/YrhL